MSVKRIFKDVLKTLGFRVKDLALNSIYAIKLLIYAINLCYYAIIQSIAIRRAQCECQAYI